MMLLCFRVLAGLGVWTYMVSGECNGKSDAEDALEFTGQVSETEFHLSGGIDPSVGYLHVRNADNSANGSWARVCSHNLDSEVAHALCVQLGHKLACEFREIDRKGQGSMETGEPDAITEAAEVTFGTCSWLAGEDVDCPFHVAFFNQTSCDCEGFTWLHCASENTNLELSLLLEDSSFDNAGTLRARCGGTKTWSAVCATDHWDPRDGEVVCRHLGFSHLVAVESRFGSPEEKRGVTTRDEHEDGTRGHAIFSEIGCAGAETDLLNCSLIARGTCLMYAFVSCGREIRDYDPPVGLCGAKDLCGKHCTRTLGGMYRTGCQCDPLCAAFGDCCYDHHLNCYQGNRSSNATDVDGVDIKYYRCIQVLGHTYAFDLVAACPPDADEDVVQRCEGSSNGPDITASIPVSDGAGANYRNIYCAACHGLAADDVEVWEMSVGYSKNYPTLEPSLNVTLPAKPLRFAARLPAEAEDNIRPCLAPEAVDTCEKEFKGTEVANACQDFAAPVHLMGVLFKNPYCALCNNESASWGENCWKGEGKWSCPMSTPWLPCKYIALHPDSEYFLTIEVLFTFRSVSGTEEDCFPGEVYFPFLRACRAVQCRGDFAVKVDECVQGDPQPPPSCFGGNNTVETGHVTYDTSNSVNQLVKSCLKTYLGSPERVFYWDAGYEHGSNRSRYYVNLLVLDYNTLEFISRGILSEGFPVHCNITRMSLFMTTPDNFLHIDLCLNHTVDVSQAFSGLCPNDERHMLVLAAQYAKQITDDAVDVSTVPWVCLQHNLTCAMGLTLDPSEFRLHTIDNESVLENRASGMTLREGEFLILPDGRAYVCLLLPTTGPVSDTLRNYLSFALSTISLAALLATFINYCLLPTLRNFAGRCIMNLVVALFIAYLALMVSGLANRITWLCLGLAAVTHLTWLAAFHWMTVLSFNVARTFGRRLVSREAAAASALRLPHCMLFAWGVPFVIVGVCLMLHLCKGTNTPQIYATDGVCYISNHGVALYAFGLPVAVLVLANLIFFTFAVVKLRRQTSSSSVFSGRNGKHGVTTEFTIYCRLGVLMGLAWIVGFLTQVIPGDVIKYIHVILNSLHGFLIFASCCLTKNVRRLWRAKLQESGYLKESTRFGLTMSAAGRSAAVVSNESSTFTKISSVSSGTSIGFNMAVKGQDM